MSFVAIHPRDIHRARQTIGARTDRYRRHKENAEYCRAFESAGEAMNRPRLLRIAGKIGGTEKAALNETVEIGAGP